MYNSMYAKLPDPLSRVRRLKGVASETRSGSGAIAGATGKEVSSTIQNFVLFEAHYI